MFEKWQFFVVKNRFFKKVKKITSFSKSKKVYVTGWIRTWDLLHGNPELYLMTMEDDEKWCHFSCIYFKCPKNQLILKKKTATSQTHFGFTNMGSNMHCLSARHFILALFQMMEHWKLINYQSRNKSVDTKCFLKHWKLISLLELNKLFEFLAVCC